MTPALPAAAVRRRFLVLTLLRWLPTGFLLPLTAVFMQQRGLSLAEIGLVSATSSVVVLGLELPTGGLADALGHRRVLLAACAIDLVSVGLFLTAHALPAFLAAWVLQGVFRALDSGPLEAWFVTTSLRADEHASVERGLAAAGVAVGAGISLGALTGAALATWAPGGAATALALPVVAAIALRAADLGAVAIWVHELTPERAGVSTAVADVPSVIRSGVALLRRSRALTALVVVELLWGAGMVAVELFTGPRLEELLGRASEAVGILGVLTAVGWSVVAAGSAATPWLVARLGSPARAGAALRLAQGGAVAIAAVAGGPVGLVTAYLGFSLVHGAANAVHYGMVHRLVGDEERVTVLSLNSLSARIGSAAAALGFGVLASRSGLPVVYGLAAALLALGAPLYRRAGSVRAGQSQAVAGDVVEDHLPAHRRGAQEAGEAPHVGQAVLRREPVAAVDLDGLVQ
jgi:predicted MFS family arabinose efflux permease